MNTKTPITDALERADARVAALADANASLVAALEAYLQTSYAVMVLDLDASGHARIENPDVAAVLQARDALAKVAASAADTVQL